MIDYSFAFARDIINHSSLHTRPAEGFSHELRFPQSTTLAERPVGITLPDLVVVPGVARCGSECVEMVTMILAVPRGDFLSAIRESAFSLGPDHA